MQKTIVIFMLLLGMNTFAQFNNSYQYWNKGVDYFREGDYLRAYEQMSKYLKLNPENENAYHNRAVCAENLGDHESGCKDYEISRSLGPKRNLIFHSGICNNELWIKRFSRYY